MYSSESFIKIIRIIFLFIIVRNTCAMDLSVITQSPEQAVTFKSLEGFACWSLNKINKSWHTLSTDTRKKIEEQSVMSDDEKFLALFNVATKLSVDLQKEIAIHVYKGHDGAIKKFFNDPLTDVVSDYVLSYKVFYKEELHSFRKVCKNSTHWALEIIFEQVKDIVAFESWRHSSNACDYKQLQSINKVYNVFVAKKRLDKSSLSYEFRDSYTLTNFLKYQDLRQWRWLPIVIAPFLFELIDSFVSAELSRAEIFSRNEKKEILNAFIQNNFEKTGDKEWLLFMRKIIIPGPDDKTVGVFLWYMFSVLCSWGIETYFHWDWWYENCFKYFMWDKYKIANIGATVIYIQIPPVIFSLPLAFLHTFFLDQYINRPILELICVIGCYVAICSLINIRKMRSLQKESTDIQKLSALLQRKDIEIV